MLLKSIKASFQVIKNRYSVEIKSDIFNFKLITEERGNKFFACKKMIESDLSVNFEKIKDLPKDTCATYFNVFKDLGGEVFNVYGVDISAAYPTVLRNCGYISDKTYRYLMSIKKSERLAAIGQIAGKKTIYQFTDGEFSGVMEKRSEFFYVFFDLVNKTNEFMRELKYVFSDYNYKVLFIWVDCIYIESRKGLRDINLLKAIEKVLEKQSYAYKFTVHKLDNFTAFDNEKNFILNYDKEGKNKTHIVPKLDENRVFFDEIENIILNN